MKTPILTPELETVARRVIWFEKPEQALADPIRFLTYAMCYGADKDMEVAQRQFTNEDLIETLKNAPAGIFNEEAWKRWHLKLGLSPIPPLPERRFE
jgi:hypothetical protein